MTVLRLVAICAFAFLLRAEWILWTDGGTNPRLDHQDQGAGIALNMLEGRGFVFRYKHFDPGEPWKSFRMPLLPLFLYGLWSLFGYNVLLAKLVLALVSTLNVALIALLAKELYGPGAAMIAAGLAAIFPNFIFWPMTLAPETLATSFLLLATLLLAKRRLLAAGTAAGLLVLSRPVYYPYALCLAAWTAIAVRGPDRWKRVTRFCVPVLLLIAPWAYRNWRVHRGLLLTSTEGGMTFLECNNPLSFAGAGDWQYGYLKSLPGMEETARRLGEVKFDKLMYRTGLAHIADDPLGYLRVFLLRLTYLWRPFPRIGPRSGHSWAHAAVMLATWLPIFLMGLGQMIRGRVWRLREHGPIVLALAWVSFAAGLVNGVIRYRAPLEPFFVIYAAAFLASLLAAGSPASAAGASSAS